VVVVQEKGDDRSCTILAEPDRDGDEHLG
jgi:hypothetical protein